MPKKTPTDRPPDLRDTDFTAHWAIDALRCYADVELREGGETDGPGEINRAADFLAAARVLERRCELVAGCEAEIKALEADLASHQKEIAKLRGQTAKAPAPELAVTPAAGAAKCKHTDWDTSTTPPRCKKCGKEKSARGRKNVDPAANVQSATVEGVTKIDPPSMPLPVAAAPAKPKRRGHETEGGVPIETDDDDPFAGGTVGAR